MNIGDSVGLNSENGLNTKYQIYLYFKNAANNKDKI